MSGAKWRCWCGSTNIQSTLVRGRTLRRGKWGIEADCADCGRKLLFTKHGMREIGKERNMAEKDFIPDVSANDFNKAADRGFGRRNMANKYSELLGRTHQVGRELIDRLVEADIREADELKALAKTYQEFADRVQALVMGQEVYK